MELKELLDELRSNVLRDVTTAVQANPANYLWSDATLVRYINDAENKFARRTRCLRDSTTAEVVEVELEAGVEFYPLHAAVIGVMSARINNIPMRRASDGALSGSPGDVTMGTRTVDTSQIGRPHWFSTDENASTLRVYPIPDEEFAGVILRMRVERLPLTPLTLSNKTASPEVSADYHLDLLEWAAFKALRNHDADGENMQKANTHRAAFNTAIEEVARDIKTQSLAPVQFGVHARY